MSSSSDPLQNSFDSHEPRQELELPFLNEEFLADEARIAQWRVPAPGFQPESPFLEAFEEEEATGRVEEFEDFFGELDEQETIPVSVYSGEDEAVSMEAEENEYRESNFETEAALWEESYSPSHTETMDRFEQLMPKPIKTQQEEVRDLPHILVVDDKDMPVTNGEYAFHQGNLSEHGEFSEKRKGHAYFSKIDLTQPFMFEVRDRVCAIRSGAFLNPDDPKIEYGGTWFDWTLVRDDKKADKNFWPHYQQEMDLAVQDDTAFGSRIERFLQHEHITRRPIRVAKPFLSQLSKVQIRATPAHIRVGPFVRYTDYARSVIWMETVTPSMIRVRYKKTGDSKESSRYASTVRVGGRHFAAVEIDDLQEEKFYDYTVEVVPLPSSGAIPIAQKEFEGVFPKLTTLAATSMKKQLASASLSQNEWLTFRTLRQKYDKQLKFATGSCRWYPGDKENGKDWGPDMLHGLGDWLRTAPKEKWPHFLFFGGDQIYSDQIGDDHGEMMIRGRFAARIPGPVDSASSVRDKLIDGAWAGRFAHRYKAYKDPDTKFVENVRDDLKKLDELYEKYPEIKSIYHRYPKTGTTDKESRVLAHQLMTGLTWGLGGKVSDQETYSKALTLLKSVDKLNLKSGSYRAFLPHWTVGFRTIVRRNPMANRYISHNFLLWQIPDFEPLLPTVVDGSNSAIVQPNHRGHLAAAGGRHAADFAEYAYLYERSWTSSRSVRVLLAQVPTFLMLDDHEATDDWNFDLSWVRMLHNEKDAYRMWPKTLTDSLAAYWMYQGWCNKAPSQWKIDDPRVKALAAAQQQGIDALPALRRCIHRACFTPLPPKDPKASYQSGMSLEWHYKLPFDPPFLVPDCRTRKLMIPADDKLRIIDHDDPKKRPMSQTIDDAQLAWMRQILVEKGPAGPVAFIALSTPLLLQKQMMNIMMKPETTAEAWDQANLPSLVAAATSSTMLGIASDSLLRVFRRATDLEHMIRDKSWRDLWGLVDAMRKTGSQVKTLVLVSGDVHHNYCMTANLPGSGRPKPELLQITCSGLQTTIRSSGKAWLAAKLSELYFKIGNYRLEPGFMSKNSADAPSLALFQNAVAIVTVAAGVEVDVRVDYLSDKEVHIYKYTSGSAYMDGEYAGSPWHRRASKSLEALEHEIAEDDEVSEDEASLNARDDSAEEAFVEAFAQEDREEFDWLTENSDEEESEGATESVEVELQTPKQGVKKLSLHNIPTTDIFMHVYFKKLDVGYTRQQFFDWIVDQSPSDMGANRFDLAGLSINLISNPSTAAIDFKSSLQSTGSVVVYFGHTVLGTNRTLGLTPYDPGRQKPDITCPELTNLLNTAKAKIVVLAGCATSQCITKIRGDTVVIVTQSGKDRLTNTLQWAPAIKALLDEFLAGGTVGDALAAANKNFSKASSTDKFQMINGDPTLKVI